MKCQQLVGPNMTNRVKSLVLILIMALAPLVPIASAHPSIGLSTDVSHIILSPGETTNITLTIDNNGSSIESYAIDVSGYDKVWEIIPSDVNVSNVISRCSDYFLSHCCIASSASLKNQENKSQQNEAQAFLFEFLDTFFLKAADVNPSRDSMTLTNKSS